VAEVKTYTVHAKRWTHGWELHVDTVGVTQSHGLADAAAMARSYIAMMTGAPIEAVKVDIVPEIGGGLDEAITGAREAARQAVDAQAAATARWRGVARQLAERGLSGRDIAVALGVSPQRVSQLLAAPDGDVAKTKRGGRQRKSTAA
jgi:hypothetical protein